MASHDLEAGDTSANEGTKPNGDKLKLFRDLVGINPIPPSPKSSKRPAENMGTYKRLVDAEAKARVEYYATASAINACLLLQIIVAAALTSLGASSGSHVVITILGAINTVIAGIMTYLKGQGLPTRLLEYANGLRKVREYIEEQERQFTRSDCKLDLDKEVNTIIAMYEAVRQNAEDNYPNSWKSLNPSSPKDKLLPNDGSQPKYDSIGDTSAIRGPGAEGDPSMAGGAGSPPPGQSSANHAN